MGLPGAFLAVPVAAAVRVLLAHLLGAEDASQAEERTDTREGLKQEGLNPQRAQREAVDGASSA